MDGISLAGAGASSGAELDGRMARGNAEVCVKKQDLLPETRRDDLNDVAKRQTGGRNGRKRDAVSAPPCAPTKIFGKCFLIDMKNQMITQPHGPDRCAGVASVIDICKNPFRSRASQGSREKNKPCTFPGRE